MFGGDSLPIFASVCRTATGGSFSLQKNAVDKSPVSPFERGSVLVVLLDVGRGREAGNSLRRPVAAS
ncbi:hypothetical protein MTX20_09785 [Bradyrhizobium sp. ISRA435]|nr:hypothetical protein MTX20_09785 [Bradyrhizobium sp. ISRA435]